MVKWMGYIRPEDKIQELSDLGLVIVSKNGLFKKWNKVIRSDLKERKVSKEMLVSVL